jgi:uncharacterized phage protein gp47/JayE
MEMDDGRKAVIWEKKYETGHDSAAAEDAACRRAADQTTEGQAAKVITGVFYIYRLCAQPHNQRPSISTPLRPTLSLRVISADPECGADSV